MWIITKGVFRIMFVRVLLTIISPYTALIPSFYVAYKVIKNKDIISRNPWNTGLFSLFVWSLIVGIINHNFISAVLSVVFLLYFCLSVFIENYYNDEDKIEKLFKLMIYISIGAAFIGIVEKIVFMYWSVPLWAKLLGVAPYAVKNHRIYSTFGNPNVAGSWFANMILICIYFSDRAKRFEKTKTFYQASMCLFAAALCLTGSRGAALGLFCGLFIYVFLQKNKENFGCLIIVSILIAVLVLAPSQVPHIKDLMGHKLDGSINSRELIWEGCLNMFKLKPLTGWGLMGIYYEGYSFINFHLREVHAHNLWITIAATLGIVGLSIYIYMKFYLFEGLKLLYNQNCKLVPLLAGIQAIVIGHGIVDFTIMAPQTGLLFILCSSFISSLMIQYNTSLVHDTVPVTSYNSLL